MRQQIETAVKIVLSKFTSKPPDEIENTDELYFDLGIGDNRKRLVCSEFEKILKDMQSHNRISVQECRSLKTVQDCIDLLISKL